MSQLDQIKWNQKYKEKISHDSLPQPNSLLKELAPLLQGKHALDIACGLGGNSVYLSQLGFIVTAWDISNIAIDYLNLVSKQHGLAIQGEVVDLDVAVYRRDTFDLVVDTFYLNRPLFPQIQHLVKPDGLFFMQTFMLTTTESHSHISDQYKLKPNELKDIFADWEILHFNQDEAKGLQSILARKKE